MSSDDRRGPSRGLAAAVAGSEAALPWLFALYAAATLLHSAHNAQYLAQYPNLPASWSRAEVYAAWCALMGLGLLGLALYGFRRRRIGRVILGLYACLGVGALLHYTRAPLMHHSSMMNVTIWAEAAAGTALLASVLMLGAPAVRLRCVKMP